MSQSEGLWNLPLLHAMLFSMQGAIQGIRDFADLPSESLFEGVARLFGPKALKQLLRSHVMVVGLGGVGSWAAEALARTGVGKITLVDGDVVAPSNTNRQLPALCPHWGRPKAVVLAERLQQIHPQAQIQAIVRFFHPSEEAQFFQTPPNLLIDAIDRPSAKAGLLATARKYQIPTICCGGAGGRRDPTRIQVADLAQTSHDPLLQKVRSLLRRKYHFPKGDQPFGIPCVYSTESMATPYHEAPNPSPNPPGSLNCTSGYGTVVFVTGVFGFVAAAEAVRLLLQQNEPPAS